VRAGNVGGVSAFSTPSRFTTIVGIPGPPALITPQDLAVNQPLEITFRWSPAAAAARYVLQVGRDSTFAADFVYADSSLTDTLQTVAAFAHSTRYFWRVGAANVSGSGDFSPTWRFTTGLAQTALAAPADGATDQPVTVALSWHPTPGAAAYLVQVSPDSTFSSGLTLDDQNVTDTTRSVSGLAHDVRYFWRVAANNASSNGPFSTVRAFRTIVAIPQTTQLASPADGEVLTSGSVSFSWHPAVPAVDRYALEFGNDSLFSASIADSTITDTSRTFAIPSGSGKYWWRVRAHNAAGWGPNSDARSFTLLISSAQEDREIPKQFSLSQNYPNPFNPSTVIRYGLPTRSEVSLVVYNIIGQEVRQLVSGTQEAGYHQYTFDATGLPSGFYFYRLHAGDFLSTKKLILLK
jgi:hypothetical protein